MHCEFCVDLLQEVRFVLWCDVEMAGVNFRQRTATQLEISDADESCLTNLSRSWRLLATLSAAMIEATPPAERTTLQFSIIQ